MKIFLAAFLTLILLGGNILLPHEIGQNVDPFYLKRLENGERSFLAGDIEAAVEELEVALFGLGENKELRSKACVYLGLSYYILRNNEEAIKYLSDSKNLMGMEGLRALIPEESVWMYLNRALVELKLLEVEEKQPAATENQLKLPPRKPITSTKELNIARDIELRIKINPQDASLYYELYDYHMSYNHVSAAKKTLEDLIKRNPSEARGYYLLGRIQYDQEEFKDAEKSFGKVIELQTSVPIEESVLLEAMAYQILALQLQGKTERTTQMFAQRSDHFSKEIIRFLGLNEQDRDLFMGIAQNEATLAEIERLRDQGVIGNRTKQIPMGGETRSAEAARMGTEPSGETKAGDLVPLDSVDLLPILKKRVDPIYPPSGKALGIEGRVIVNALISETGDITEVVIVKGLAGGFNDATMKAVRDWKYEPAIKDGQNVKVWMPITVTFKID